MKKELLSPAGNMETLYQAIHNGADAVYIGGKNFGARKFAPNFSDTELIEAIKYAHLYGVKIYVTTNTLIFEDEIEPFLGYIKFLYLNDVDAVIMQDMGMIVTVKKMFPNLEIHASTQAHNHNNENLNLLKRIGVKRAILAREMSLSEINSLTCDIDKEIFIHGALCVCYSGCCLFSSLNGGRSGNRGECVGSCRLPYQLIKNTDIINTNGDYLLSTKELNTLNHFKDILDSNVTSLKIEGRMKSPEYVGFITKLYRHLIDEYYNNEPLTITDDDIYKLKKLFNRDFTSGYLFNNYGTTLMNIKTPNHLGVKIGETIKVTSDKIWIKLTDNLHQEDGIRFTSNNEGMIVNKLYNEKGLLVSNISNGDIAGIDNKINLNSNSDILKTTDVLLLKELKNYELKRIKINFKITAHINEPLSLEVFDDQDNHFKTCGPIVSTALTTPLTEDRIKEQLSKLGNTPFILDNIDIIMDENIFINLKDINDIRRNIIEKLIIKRQVSNKEHPINKIDDDKVVTNKTKSLNVLVRNEEQLKASIDASIDNIYVANKTLYEKYKTNNHIYLRLPRVMRHFDEYNDTNILVSELGSIYKYLSNNNVISDSYLNVTNSKSAYFLHQMGIKQVTLSPEIDLSKAMMLPNGLNLEVIIYGRMELMIMKYCPLNMLVNNDNKSCNICHQDNKYYLRSKENLYYPIVSDNCLTYIMHHKNINLIDNIKDYKKIGINNFRLELFDESYDEVIKLINNIKKEF